MLIEVIHEEEPKINISDKSDHGKYGEDWCAITEKLIDVCWKIR